MFDSGESNPSFFPSFFSRVRHKWSPASLLGVCTVVCFSEATPVGRRPARVSRKHSVAASCPSHSQSQREGHLQHRIPRMPPPPLCLIYLTHENTILPGIGRGRDERTKRFPLDRLSVTERLGRRTDVRGTRAGGRERSPPGRRP